MTLLLVMAIPTHIDIVRLYMQHVPGISTIQTEPAWILHAVAACVTGLFVVIRTPPDTMRGYGLSAMLTGPPATFQISIGLGLCNILTTSELVGYSPAC